MWLRGVQESSQVHLKSPCWHYQASRTWAFAGDRKHVSSAAETGLWTSLYYLPEVTFSPATHCLILLTAEPYYRGRMDLSCLEMSGQGLGNLFNWFYIHAQSILQASQAPACPSLKQRHLSCGIFLSCWDFFLRHGSWSLWYIVLVKGFS